MRMVLSSWGGRGDGRSPVALASQLQERGVDVRACASPDGDFVERFAAVGVELVPVGPATRELATAVPRPSIPETAARIIAEQVEALPAVAEGCDVVVATGALPAAAGALTVAESLGIRSVSVTFQQLTVPSLHRPPLTYPGRPMPPGRARQPRAVGPRRLEHVNALFGEALNTSRASIGLPPPAQCPRLRRRATAVGRHRPRPRPVAGDGGRRCSSRCAPGCCPIRPPAADVTLAAFLDARPCCRCTWASAACPCTHVDGSRPAWSPTRSARRAAVPS